MPQVQREGESLQKSAVWAEDVLVYSLWSKKHQSRMWCIELFKVTGPRSVKQMVLKSRSDLLSVFSGPLIMIMPFSAIIKK